MIPNHLPRVVRNTRCHCDAVVGKVQIEAQTRGAGEIVFAGDRCELSVHLRNDVSGGRATSRWRRTVGNRGISNPWERRWRGPDDSVWPRCPWSWGSEGGGRTTRNERELRCTVRSRDSRRPLLWYTIEDVALRKRAAASGMTDAAGLSKYSAECRSGPPARDAGVGSWAGDVWADSALRWGNSKGEGLWNGDAVRWDMAGE